MRKHLRRIHRHVIADIHIILPLSKNHCFLYCHGWNNGSAADTLQLEQYAEKALTAIGSLFVLIVLSIFLVKVYRIYSTRREYYLPGGLSSSSPQILSTENSSIPN